jgi:ornithine decarboxylase
MAAVDIIAPSHHAHLDNVFSRSPVRGDGFPGSFKERSILHKQFARPRTLSLNAAQASRFPPSPSPAAPETLDLFPGLPPLHSGRVETHLRSGVITATQNAADGETDAERAFFVADLSTVHAQHVRWQRALPDIEPFYAVKCNPDPYVLRLLAALGTGFDCASNGEIGQVLALGVEPGRIIFANPCKPTSFVRAAQRANVRMMTFDNADELHKIARVFPAAQLVLRILTDDSAALCQLGLKFGASLEAAPGLLALAKQLKLDVVGISFHVGSGSTDTNAFADAVARARRAFDMGTAVGYDLRLLDVGGGFEATPDFELRAGVLRDALNREFADRRERGIRVIAEPGRFYVANAFCLATCVIARRSPIVDPEVQVAEANKPNTMCRSYSHSVGRHELILRPDYINDGVYGAFNCILFDHQHPVPHVLSMGGSFHVPSSAPHGTCSVWGPTCDSIDCVAPAARLPAALAIGDWLWFEQMGAYTRCAASRFNGFEVSDVVYTAGTGRGASEVRRVLAEAARAAEA